MKTFHSIACGVMFAAAAGPAWAQAVAVPIRIVVKQKDVGAPTPFPHVPGFTILRNNTPFANAQCPDASDANGELTCRLTCSQSDRDATLRLMPPRRENAGSILAGMTVPVAPELKVVNCQLVTAQPVELVYRTFAAQLAELRAASPDVYAAATTTANGKVRLKPFAAAAPGLEQLARSEDNRRAILELGELARLSPETGDYATGTKSVVLKAQATNAVGPVAAARLVALSPEPVELDRSITRVTNELRARTVLNKDELQLQRAAKALSGKALYNQ